MNFSLFKRLGTLFRASLFSMAESMRIPAGSQQWCFIPPLKSSWWQTECVGRGRTVHKPNHTSTTSGHTCVWQFGHLADPCKKQADTEVNMLVKTQTPRTRPSGARTQPHKYHQWQSLSHSHTWPWHGVTVPPKGQEGNVTHWCTIIHQWAVHNKVIVSYPADMVRIFTDHSPR